jgi:hypothetical protein
MYMNEYYAKIEAIGKEIKLQHNQTLVTYKSIGETEGRMNIPTSDFLGLSPSEATIKSIYEASLARFNAETDQVVTAQRASFEHIGSELNELHNNPSITIERLRNINIDSENQINLERNGTQTRINQILTDSTLVSARSEYEMHDKQHSELSSKLGRNQPTLPQFWYYPILILMGVSEFYLTYGAFSTFGGNVLETTVMALSAGIVFPILAHYAGKILKQHEKNKNNISVLIIIILIAGGLSFYLAKQIVNQGITAGYILTTAEANTILVMRNLIVLGIFLVGILISFFNHEASINFLDT